MLEPIHALGELVVDPSVVGVCFEVVFVDDFLGDYSKLDACLLWLVQWSHEVKIGEVHGHEPCAGGRKGAIDDKLDQF